MSVLDLGMRKVGQGSIELDTDLCRHYAREPGDEIGFGDKIECGRVISQCRDKGMICDGEADNESTLFDQSLVLVGTKLKLRDCVADAVKVVEKLCNVRSD